MSHFPTDLLSSIELPVPVTNFPYWTVLYRPAIYNPELIPSLGECYKLVEKARVQLRGWDFPHLSHRETESANGSNWISSWANFMGSIEYWRLYQSGQFVHFSAVEEATNERWRQQLQQAAMSHARHRADIDWQSVPGYISLVNLVYNVTERFEFAARIAQAGVYRGSVEITIEIVGIKNFVLTTDFDRFWLGYYRTGDDRLRKTWQQSSEQLVAGSADCSLPAIVWLCECFGWMSPNTEAIKQDQLKLLTRKL